MNQQNHEMHTQDNEESSSGRRLALAGGLALAAAMAALLCLALALVGVFWLSGTRTAPSRPPAPLLGAASGTSPADELSSPPALELPPSPAAPTNGATASATPGDAAVNRIVFVDTTGRIGTVAPDGSESRLLTETGATYQFPAWSPDSRQIAAVGTADSEAGVYVWADEAGAARADLYSSRRRAPIYLYWSPDSRQVSFLANDRNGLGLWLAGADGNTPARQIASGQPFYWNWSQRGDQLFFHAGGAGSDAKLAFLDPGSRQAGDNVARPGLFQAPGISADGRYLAYGAAEGERFQVVVEDQTSGERTAVPHVGLAALSWSPTAQHLAWTSPRADRMTFAGPLRLLDAASGQNTTLVRDTVIGFFWSPDGQRIAYLTLDGGSDNPGAGRPAGLAALSASPQPQLGDLRLRLAVVDVASGQQRALRTFRPSEIFLSQFIPFFDQYALSHRLWSPASDALVLPMVDGSGKSSIYVVSVDSGEATRVADGTMAFWSWR